MIFATTVGGGELETMGNGLINSLDFYYPSEEKIVFIDEEEIDKISDEILSNLENKSKIKTGALPIEDYPISAQLEAFRLSCELADEGEKIMMVDTDTIFLDRLSFPSKDADLYARPVSIGTNYWASKCSQGDWNELFETFEIEHTQTNQLRTAIDNKIVKDYYNSGVVITTDKSLGEDLLETTKTLVEEDLLETDEFFADQIALKLCSLSRNTYPLSIKQNYPLLGYIRIPEDVEILHYGSLQRASRILERDVAEELRSFGVPAERSFTNIMHSFGELLSARAGHFINYRQKRIIRDYL